MRKEPETIVNDIETIIDQKLEQPPDFLEKIFLEKTFLEKLEISVWGILSKSDMCAEYMKRGPSQQASMIKGSFDITTALKKLQAGLSKVYDICYDPRDDGPKLRYCLRCLQRLMGRVASSLDAQEESQRPVGIALTTLHEFLLQAREYDNARERAR